VTFYILVSFQRGRIQSLEAGVKYLILGALSSAVLVYGIAAHLRRQRHHELWRTHGPGGRTEGQLPLPAGVVAGGDRSCLQDRRVSDANLGAGCLSGRSSPGDRLSCRRFEGGGLRALVAASLGALPHELVANWSKLFMVMAAVTILYGSLCAIPQRSLKRLLGYSSIANAVTCCWESRR